MRACPLHCAAQLIAAALAAAPAAAQEADGMAYDSAQPPAEAPLTPEETVTLGNALQFDPAEADDRKPATPLRLPGLNDAGKFAVSHTDKPNGSSTLVLTPPAASEWDVKVGADLKLAATPADGYRPGKPLAAADSGQDSGAAWASLGLTDRASLEARVDPGNDRGKLGTTLKQSISVGGKFALTLQDSYSVSESLGAAAPASTDLPLMAAPTAGAAAAQVWSSEKAVKFDIQTTGTTLGAGLTSASNDPVTHNRFSAEQKLYGPLHVTTSVADVGEPSASKSIAAGLTLHW